MSIKQEKNTCENCMTEFLISVKMNFLLIHFVELKKKVFKFLTYLISIIKYH